MLLCWQTNNSSSFCSLSAVVSADGILIGFCSYLHQQYFYWALVPGWTLKNPTQQQALNVVCNYIMTLQDFQKTITKDDWYGKYLWFTSFCTYCCKHILLLRFNTKPGKIQFKTYSYFRSTCRFILIYFRMLCFISTAKQIQSFDDDNNFSIERKKQIISMFLDKLNVQYSNNQETFYSFIYQRKWWTRDYNVYLNIDSEKFCVTVLLKTSYLRGGFIDFGGSERLRNRIISIIKILIADE